MRETLRKKMQRETEERETLTRRQCRARYIYTLLRTTEKLSFPWFARRRFMSFNPNARELVQCKKTTRAIGWSDEDNQKKGKKEKEELDRCARVLNEYRTLYRTGTWIDDL